MGSPKATQVGDSDYAGIDPAVQWTVKTHQHDSNYENERRAYVLTELQLLKEKIEETGIGSKVQKLVSLLKKSKARERQENEFQSDCNSEITKLQEDLRIGNGDNDPHDFLDCSIFDLSKKLKFAKKELSIKLRELVSLKRQLDELPIEAELVQYGRRFSELNVHMQDRLCQTRKYYETYNALLEIKDLMLKETSLLNSVDSQFADAIGDPAGRTKLIDSMEAIMKGIQQKLEKVQFGLQVEQKTLDTLREQYSAAIMDQRHCSVLLKNFQEECRKNERLKMEFALHEKQGGQTSSSC
ncbi:coiled-coil domain-containing protein 93 homolog isoform X2 [Chenopodium quinoa]|uniref:coiled-coil domain-containing protein 93 homolog isoform X2 n=1 Tax=Chenopodium quinoa TaxID=63459 RepID=UPI000B76BD4D|nr:coiled-coil domain-containing protein 93 homolog isoform X2 [Chenopodium quinoa]XP_021746317.1 coiled-coil domain-containing protein 93 homolog isoform X2 [Chenopodium quinoa]